MNDNTIATIAFLTVSIILPILGIVVTISRNNSDNKPVVDKDLEATLYLYAVQKSGSNIVWNAGTPKFFAEKVVVENGYLHAVTNNMEPFF